jgi:hypothetical protein
VNNEVREGFSDSSLNQAKRQEKKIINEFLVNTQP